MWGVGLGPGRLEPLLPQGRGYERLSHSRRVSTLTNGRRAGATADDLSVNSGADAGIVAGRAHY